MTSHEVFLTCSQLKQRNESADPKLSINTTVCVEEVIFYCDLNWMRIYTACTSSCFAEKNPKQFKGVSAMFLSLFDNCSGYKHIAFIRDLKGSAELHKKM